MNKAYFNLAVAAFISLPILAFWAAPALAASDDLEIYHVAIGQADATLVRGPEDPPGSGTRKTLLIDAGNDWNHIDVFAVMSRHGITQIDYAIATHYDSDHIGGFDGLFALAGQPEVCLDRGGSHTGIQWSEYLGSVTGCRQTIALGDLSAQGVDLGGGVTAACVCVDGLVIGGGYSDPVEENGRSIGIVISYDDFDYLIAGDLTSAVEPALGAALVSPANGVQPIDVYRVNHHGSDTSSARGFLGMILPEVSICSTGNTEDQMPKCSVYDRICSIDSTIYQTDEGNPEFPACPEPPPGCGVLVNGTVMVYSDGASYWVSNGDDWDEYECAGVTYEPHTIYEIQNPEDPNHAPEGTNVLVEDVIVTGISGSELFFVEEPGAGPWSGLLVYDGGLSAPEALARSNKVTVQGVVVEFNEVTEISAVGVVPTGTGQPVPGPDELSSAGLAGPGGTAESYEGVLVRIVDPVVTNENPDAPLDHGEFEVDEVYRVDDLFFEHNPDLMEGFTSMTGVQHYSFGNYKLEPRNCSDYDPDVCNAELHTIYEIQDESHPSHPDTGTRVRVEGVIVTGVDFLSSSSRYFVEEPAGGPWSGLMIYDEKNITPHDLARGDRLTLIGVTADYFGMTEIKIDSVTRTASGQPVPGPDAVSSADICDEGGALAESYEGILVRVLDAVVTDTNPKGRRDDSSFEVDECLLIGDQMVEYHSFPDEVFSSITGIHSFTYGHFKLEPRDTSDLASTCPDDDGDGYAGEECGGPDCCDVGSEPACGGVWPGALNPGAAENIGVGNCTDGADNDCDGLADGDDPGCTPSMTGVLISELYYDHTAGDEGYEYMELYSTGAETISLEGWELQWGGKDFNYGKYTFPAGLSIGPGEHFLVGEAEVASAFCVAPDLEVDFDPAIQDGGSPTDGVRLVNQVGIVNDTLLYDTPNTNDLSCDRADPCPDAYCAPDVPGGRALSRKAPHTDTDDCSADFRETDPLPRNSSGGISDEDGDGYSPESCGGTDCNDGDPLINPGRPEVPVNGKDDDCDDLTDEALFGDLGPFGAGDGRWTAADFNLSVECITSSLDFTIEETVLLDMAPLIEICAGSGVPIRAVPGPDGSLDVSDLSVFYQAAAGYIELVPVCP